MRTTRLVSLMIPLCACASSSEDPEPIPGPCDSAYVGTWTSQPANDTVRFSDDCTWEQVTSARTFGGVWSIDGEEAKFSGRKMQVLGDVMVFPYIRVEHEPYDPLINHDTSLLYPQIAGGSGFADSTWDGYASTNGWGGSCGQISYEFHLELMVDGTAYRERHTTCFSANQPTAPTDQYAGTWEETAPNVIAFSYGSGTATTTEAWARFGDQITDVFAIRAP